MLLLIRESSGLKNIIPYLGRTMPPGKPNEDTP
jgi:hypothetical protein